MGNLVSKASEAGGRGLGSGAASAAIPHFKGDIQQKLNEASQTISSMRDTLGTAESCLQCVSYCTAFSTAISTFCTAYKTMDETASRSLLLQLGKAVADDVKHIDQSVNVVANLSEPRELSQHIYSVVKNEVDKATRSCFFVFHPGNNWHSEFSTLLKQSPLPGLCGIFDDVGAMAVYLSRFRQVVGPEPTINILVPTAHVYVIPEFVEFPEQLQPFKIIGERGRNQQPFTYMIGNAEVWQYHVIDVGILSEPETQATLTTGDHARAVAAGTAAGVAASIAGGAIGSVLGPAGTVAGLTFAGSVAGLAAGCDVEDKRRERRIEEKRLKNSTLMNERAAMK